MNNYDLKMTKENLLKSLESDELKRNKFINNLLKLVNAMTENSIISLDGGWGTGKSVFVKKIELINHDNTLKTKNIINIDKDTINDFQDKYTVYYYNAWENDNHIDPLKSIIYKIICDYPEEKNQIIGNTLPINLSLFINNITKGLYDVDKVSSYKDLVDEIFTTDKIKDSLNKLLDEISNKKRILVIIDELDRCNPDFAVRLIETIKHFYNNDKLVFLLSSNNKELAHTVSKFYGDKFDGYGYLNKIYDFVFTLNEINTEDYIKYIIKVTFSNEAITSYIIDFCDKFKFGMREINRYVKYISLLSNYFNNSDLTMNKKEKYVIKYIFMPYCIALKIEDIESYNEFINGNKIDEIINMTKDNTNIKDDIKYIIENNDDEFIEKFIKDVYNKYFISIKNEYNIKRVRNEFIDTLSLLDNIRI